MLLACAHCLLLYNQINLIQVLDNGQLLISQGHNCIHNAPNALWHTVQSTCCPKTCSNSVLKALKHGSGSLGWHRRYLAPTFMQLVESIYKRLASFMPNPLYYSKTSSPNQYPTFYFFNCLIQMVPILHHPSEVRHTSLISKAPIYCRRVFCYRSLLGCMEEELGKILSHLK